MGIWNAITRMFQGKPVFDMPQNQGGEASVSTDPNASYKKDVPPERAGQPNVEPSHRFDRAGNEQPPEVTMSACKYRTSGSTAQLWATLHNNSPVNVHVDRINMCGNEMRINYPLAPAQTRDVLVHDGNLPPSPNDCYSQLYYKDKGTGDYYVSQHMINFQDNQDGTFLPTSFTHMMSRNANAADPL